MGSVTKIYSPFSFSSVDRGRDFGIRAGIITRSVAEAVVSFSSQKNRPPNNDVRAIVMLQKRKKTRDRVACERRVLDPVVFDTLLLQRCWCCCSCNVALLVLLMCIRWCGTPRPE